ncbi:Tm-1-like ATP-binding domain-containing protein [Rhodoferax sp.]|uniref:Tm-1-like ATP-binding domain-containing protein n=1 Tax=Rhodoferax sp. TaxID=50421 RepID=UPI002ACE5F15|nr:Tm-1-like ATP-binding domain-containing protein [Rhodoferax sp.]MDZ7920515.1 Tm-1-like ATP-binding domain-containing protein [Rhodoferax sp.]
MNPNHADRAPVILLIGTVDTKSDEMAYLRESVEHLGGTAMVMDVGVLGKGGFTPDILNSEVAAAAGVTLQQVMDTGDENTSMKLMATGASLIAMQWYVEGRFDGLLALGGTMGTDLALDVANALPLGCPKVLLSTIAYSPLIPPDRIPPDLIMRLWAGGLYGLNRLCKAALSQAAGAVVGACKALPPAADPRPVVGMTSLGSSALSYMKKLKPALEARGYELAVFHTTGMGGRAFEDLARRGYFAAVMDFSLQELVNDLAGSCVSAGSERLLGAGRAGLPQIVAPGATDMVDFAAWTRCPERFAGRAVHDHNRLIASVCVDHDMRRSVARAIADRLAEATGPTCLLLPTGGVEQWDRPGEPLHDPEGLSTFLNEMTHVVSPQTTLRLVDAHINDEAFVQAALKVFDEWVAEGLIAPSAYKH